MVTRDDIITVLKTIEDPEIFLDIWFLGLIYGIEVVPTETVEGAESPSTTCSIKITMTFTSPMCPAGPQLTGQVKSKLEALPGVTATEVTVTFDPAWQPSDEVKGLLGMM